MIPGTKFIALAAVAGLALTTAIGSAAAQPGFTQPGVGPAPSPEAQPGFVATPQPQQGGAPPCVNDFMPLRRDVEKIGLTVKAAIDRKDRTEICNSLKRYTAAEVKFLKYLETNAGWCGIPPEAIQQVKTSHGHSAKLRDRACADGPAGGPRIAPGPGLSEALGTSRPPADTTKKGSGTFDTLSGSTLKQ